MPYSTSGFMLGALATSKYKTLTGVESGSTPRVSIAISRADQIIDETFNLKFVTPIAEPGSEIEYISMSLAVGLLMDSRGTSEPGIAKMVETALEDLQKYLSGEKRLSYLVSRGSGKLYPSYTPDISTAQSSAMSRDTLDRMMK